MEWSARTKIEFRVWRSWVDGVHESFAGDKASRNIVIVELDLVYVGGVPTGFVPLKPHIRRCSADKGQSDDGKERPVA